MINYCTLFDHNYLYKGLALYESLETNCQDFTLWILAMSDKAYDILEKLSLPHVRLIQLAEFEDEELKRVKKTRTPVEYCWTLTPSLPLYILKKEKVPTITYIDADCFLYSNPSPIYEEMSKDSVLIIEHRYSPDKKYQEKESGIYNVEYMVFKNDFYGLKVLEWWRERCNEWCYSFAEDGKYVDQKYLDDWPIRFEKVHVLKYIGAGVAPWNIANYNISIHKNEIFINNKPLIFYHFHGLKLLENKKYDLATNFKINRTQEKIIYRPYIGCLEKNIQTVKQIDPDFHFGFSKRDPLYRRLLLNHIFPVTYKLKKILTKENNG